MSEDNNKVSYRALEIPEQTIASLRRSGGTFLKNESDDTINTFIFTYDHSVNEFNDETLVNDVDGDKCYLEVGNDAQVDDYELKFYNVNSGVETPLGVPSHHQLRVLKMLMNGVKGVPWTN